MFIIKGNTTINLDNFDTLNLVWNGSDRGSYDIIATKCLSNSMVKGENPSYVIKSFSVERNECAEIEAKKLYEQLQNMWISNERKFELY